MGPARRRLFGPWRPGALGDRRFPAAKAIDGSEAVRPCGLRRIGSRSAPLPGRIRELRRPPEGETPTRAPQLGLQAADTPKRPHTAGRPAGRSRPSIDGGCRGPHAAPRALAAEGNACTNPVLGQANPRHGCAEIKPTTKFQQRRRQRY